MKACRKPAGPVVPPRASLAFLLLLAGCSRLPVVLDPAGAEAGEISSLWWFFVAVTAAVYLAVLVWLALVLLRPRGRPSDTVPPAEADASPARKKLVVLVSTAVGLTIVLLFVLLLRDFATARPLHPPDAPDALTIRITGHQWWWSVEYQDPQPQNLIETANEIHVPVGRPVQLILQSTDVIHSFWLPQLQGKKDLVPGHPTSLWFKADRPGTYHGTCAEFCGFQHANMRLLVVAEPPGQFAAWQEAQRKPAAEPVTDEQRRGRDVFLRSACMMCHAIAGTTAASRVGPPLTHLAGRQTLGAGTLPNTRDHLAAWILDPQAIKPGVRMPPNSLAPADIPALVAYLQNLH